VGDQPIVGIVSKASNLTHKKKRRGREKASNKNLPIEACGVKAKPIGSCKLTVGIKSLTKERKSGPIMSMTKISERRTSSFSHLDNWGKVLIGPKDNGHIKVWSYAK